MKEFLRIAVVCPCKIEYEKCKSILNLNNESNICGRIISYKKYDFYEIVAIFAGPGKINCATATQFLIDKFNLDIIIDIGASGSLSDDFKYNDIIIGKEVYEFDICEIDEFNSFNGELTSKTIFTNMSNEQNEQITMIIKDIESLINSKIKFGNIASGERTIKDKKTRNEMCNMLNAHACNWETSAVIKTANLNHIHGMSIRVITDNADEEMKKDLSKNWEDSLENLFYVLNLILEKEFFRILILE